ncbi:MAG TPA: hypothetical protein PLU30_21860 [Verrucomicrobiae bacterium]|nr:hypothetical protein [Verrucomicrobiae bacterium]
MAGREAGGDSVFLNVPYDRGYERLFVALIAAVVAAGLKPRCALEIPEQGEGRLARILGLLEECRLSIHDLSRVGTPARFNMPFELGLAVAICRLKHRDHGYIVMEALEGRMAKTLSDLPEGPTIIHRGSPRRLIAELFDNLRGSRPGDAEKVYRRLIQQLPEVRKAHRSEGIVRRAIFNELVAGATFAASKLDVLQ